MPGLACHGLAPVVCVPDMSCPYLSCPCMSFHFICPTHAMPRMALSCAFPFPGIGMRLTRVACPCLVFVLACHCSVIFPAMSCNCPSLACPALSIPVMSPWFHVSCVCCCLCALPHLALYAHALAVDGLDLRFLLTCPSSPCLA